MGMSGRWGKAREAGAGAGQKDKIIGQLSFDSYQLSIW